MIQYLEEIFAKGNMLSIAIWGMYLGIVLACLLSLYEKRIIGGFVRALLKKEAFTPETALTLQALGYGKNPFVKRALRGKTALSALVYMPSEDPALPEEEEEPDESALHPRPAIRERLDFSSPETKFYIPVRLKHRAAVRYDAHGTHVMAVVTAILVFGIIALLILYFVPIATELVKKFFSAMMP